MRILILTPTLQEGGAEQVALTLIRPLLLEADVHVVTYDEDRYGRSNIKKSSPWGHIVPDGCRYTHISADVHPRLPQLVRAYRRLAKRWRPDVTLAILTYSNIIAALGRGNEVVVATEHNTVEGIYGDGRLGDRSRQLLVKGAYRRLDGLICVSDAVRDSLVGAGLVPKALRSEVVWNPIDPKFTSESSAPTSDGRNGVTFIGRLHRQKGIDVLISAAVLLSDTTQIRIVGDGPDRRSLLALAHTLKVNNVYFEGFHPDTTAFLRSARVVVLPSRWEGFGLAAVEAVACGARVISSDVGGLAELGAFLGYRLVPSEDPVALAAAIFEELKKPPIEEVKLDAFKPDIVARAYINFIRSCIRG
jgi:glycosyltransferase involved in cell wall biosynthesis